MINQLFLLSVILFELCSLIGSEWVVRIL